MTTINDALNAFLADAGSGSRRSTSSPHAIIEMLKRSLNAYAYQALGEFDSARYDKEFDEGRQFCEIFTPDRINPGDLNYFVNTYAVKNGPGTKAFLDVCGPLIEKLAGWLHDQEYWSDRQQLYFRELVGDEAGEDLLDCDQFEEVLSDYVDRQPVNLPGHLDDLADEDYIEANCEITRVEPGKLYLETWDQAGEIVVEVPQKVTNKARQGWSMVMELARIKDKWKILGLGHVYP